MRRRNAGVLATRFPVSWLIAAVLLLLGGVAAAAPSSFSVSPSTAVARSGETIPVVVRAPAGVEVSTRLYNQDPFTGQLTAFRPGQATWLSVSPAVQTSHGQPLRFRR